MLHTRELKVTSLKFELLRCCLGQFGGQINLHLFLNSHRIHWVKLDVYIMIC